MKRRDLLKELHEKKITEDEADAIFDDVVNKNSAQLTEILLLTDKEMTAYCKGATIEDLRKLRYGELPNKCHECKKEINLQKESWWRIETVDGPQTVHTTCPK